MAANLAQLNYPFALAVRVNGDIVIADTFNARVRLVSFATGIISTIAGTGVQGFNGNGQLAEISELNNPQGVAAAANGDVFISDSANQLIRRISFQLDRSTPAESATPSPTPYCPPSLYRPRPRTDLVGTLVGNAWYPGTSLPSATESSCRQSCCDAPYCDAYTFATSELQLQLFQSSADPVASCFLYTNVTALVPSSGYSSGALHSAYS